MNIILDDGFHYGIGVFETILLIENKPVFLGEHLNRIHNSMEYFKIDQKIDSEKILQFLDKQKIKNRAVLKISASPKNLFFEMKNYHYKKEQFQKGFSLIESPISRNESSPFTYHKTLNYGDNILEKRRASRENRDEPYFINTKGMIAEGATTNLFFVKKGKLFTPKTESGLLKGIVRQWVLKQYDVAEINILKDDISDYEEIFATNSLLGIMPVHSVNDIQMPSMKISFTMHKEYEKFLEKNYSFDK